MKLWAERGEGGEGPEPARDANLRSLTLHTSKPAGKQRNGEREREKKAGGLRRQSIRKTDRDTESVQGFLRAKEGKKGGKKGGSEGGWESVRARGRKRGRARGRGAAQGVGDDGKAFDVGAALDSSLIRLRPRRRITPLRVLSPTSVLARGAPREEASRWSEGGKTAGNGMRMAANRVRMAALSSRCWEACPTCIRRHHGRRETEARRHNLTSSRCRPRSRASLRNHLSTTLQGKKVKLLHHMGPARAFTSLQRASSGETQRRKLLAPVLPGCSRNLKTLEMREHTE